VCQWEVLGEYEVGTPTRAHEKCFLFGHSCLTFEAISLLQLLGLSLLRSILIRAVCDFPFSLL
jgi:hypothetical protein